MNTIYIKNMVCNRCILVVKQELDKLKLFANSVVLGEVQLKKDSSEKLLAQLKINLSALGFEVLDDSKKKLIEKIKNIIVEQVHYSPTDKQHNFSDILSKKLNKDYSYLSGLFSEVESITIEKYIINQKIEKAKELIIYNEMNVSEIAMQLGYSSVAHLSAQFKKVTGLTPSHFKKVGGTKRIPLDKL
ncbi:MAG: helix-turn-helix transcriptional regulator [Sphingobacteriales bacterium]|nr:helix-turn-helix transcriptional regulator [Sphingobacteriales bacterium]